MKSVTVKPFKVDPLDKALFMETAIQNKFPELVSILSRGNKDELVLAGDDDASLVVDLLIFIYNMLKLQNPYYDDDHPFYNEDHDDIIDEFKMTTWQKTLLNLDGDFNILLPGKRTAA